MAPNLRVVADDSTTVPARRPRNWRRWAVLIKPALVIGGAVYVGVAWGGGFVLLYIAAALWLLTRWERAKVEYRDQRDHGDVPITGRVIVEHRRSGWWWP
jgi:H+/Cl- antiporter ClcA